MIEEVPTLTISADPWTVGAFLVYLLLMIVIAVSSARFSSTGVSEFFIGGRRMKGFVVALSAVASGRSAWLIIGLTGMAYVQGVSAVWAVVGYTVVELFMFIYAAKRLRRQTEQFNSVTLPDFFAARFRDHTNVLRVVSALVIITFMIVYVAAQFDAGGKAFAGSFGFSHETGVLITAAIVLLYTLIGGFLAVSLTDVVQAMFMIVGLVVVPVVAVVEFGGLVEVLEAGAAFDGSFVNPLALGLGGFIAYVGIGLGSPGNPHILVRYMAIDDARRLRTAAVTATLWNIVMGWGAVMVGIAGRAFYPEAALLPRGDTESLYPILARAHLHPAIFGFVLAAIIAAIMSTADSQLLVGASSCVRDLYEKSFKRAYEVSQRHLVVASRVVVLALVVLALLVRELASELVFWLVLFAWSGLGASLGPALLASLFWNRATKWGILAGIVTGTVVTVVWKQVPLLSSLMYELVPAFLVSTLVLIVVSLLTFRK